MRKYLLIHIAVFILFPLLSDCQENWKKVRYEITGGYGAANVFSDLGGANRDGSHLTPLDLDIVTTRSAFFLGARSKIIDQHFSIRLNLIYGRVGGSDALTSHPPRSNRGLSFSSSIFETSLQLEYFPVIDKDQPLYIIPHYQGIKGIVINLYLFLGVGGFYFNTKSTNGGLSSYQLAVPVGLGYNYRITPRISAGIEGGMRYTSTDYIDNYYKDVNSKARDAYMFIILNVSYKLITKPGKSKL